MKQLRHTIHRGWTSYGRILLRLLLGILVLLLSGYLGLAWYMHTHKNEVLEAVTLRLRENISGTLTIAGMDSALLSAFPNVAMRLERVVLRDSLYHEHGHTFLDAGSAEIAINLTALLRGTIEIKKITVNNARIDLFADAQGHNTAAVFKKEKKSGAGKGGTLPELRAVVFNNVSFIADNRKMGKLYHMDFRRLSARLDYDGDNRKAAVSVDARVHSMAFNVKKGSFIKGKDVKGTLRMAYDAENGTVVFDKEPLNIGGEKFIIGAFIKAGGKTTPFRISIENRKIRWDTAANLLSANITRKLRMFSLKKPIRVSCQLTGDFDERGDPLIEVTAAVRRNTVITPGGTLDDCSFSGRFTNRYDQANEKSDANSAIVITAFNGKYSSLPISMRQMVVANLEHPVARGDFSSSFRIAHLSGLISDRLMKFGAGTGSVQLNYKADIQDYRLVRPFVSGVINIKDADVYYVPRRLPFKQVNMSVYITKDNLTTNTITMQCGRSNISMKGNIKNFLNLYYESPEKMVLKWAATSPLLYLDDFTGFATSEGVAGKQAAKGGESNFSKAVGYFFEKCNVEAQLTAQQMVYKKFLARNVRADIGVTGQGVQLRRASLQHGQGMIFMKGGITPGMRGTGFSMACTIWRGDIRKFFSEFNSFGMETLQAENLRGFLSSDVHLSGKLHNSGGIVPGSLHGRVDFVLNKGALVNFEPVRSVAKYAFPFRDSKNITFEQLTGSFAIKGEKVEIAPMEISTSVLNMDVSGTYSFGRGTNILIDVPLRNPEKDKDIKDESELAARRHRGIVLHLTAADDKDGKVRITLGKKNRD